MNVSTQLTRDECIKKIADHVGRFTKEGNSYFYPDSFYAQKSYKYLHNWAKNILEYDRDEKEQGNVVKE